MTRVVIDVEEVGPSVPYCAVCESPYGEPHKEGCRCTLYEMAPVNDYEELETTNEPQS
jgi:hypothetical protein